MTIKLGDIVRLPSGNVVRVGHTVSLDTIVCVYISTAWRRTRLGVTLRYEWLRAYAVRVS